ncbi:hypothetical protein KP509_33G056400 [Ceratopteris richardii]|uniref:Late embryogenesis abundant protein LEA-2 subgroup domain-containing protein n=1 Tax=Ceratopteris richardii TaxID=49495 RepID=A0A8T2QR25_CERRI|nr:hypothetical protein KP509_33G056400 [Ceratopteris richardii]
MHAKSDSEVTSLPGSSPSHSPRLQHHQQGGGAALSRPFPPAYFVQSPSRDSHDGDSKLSFQSTPLLSPVGSPLHPLANATSESRYSTSSLLPTHGRKHHHHHSRSRILPQPASPASVLSSSNHGRSVSSGYQKKILPSTIYEDDEEYGGAARKSSSISAQIYTFLFVLLSCVVFLFVFIVLFWLICRPSRPALFVKNIVFHNIYMGQGVDASGVPSMLFTVNSTVQIDFENRSRYFGAHLDPLSVSFRFFDLTVASGQMNGYVQSKSSRKVIGVDVQSLRVPLYGASVATGDTRPSLPVNASMLVCSNYYVVGKLLKSRFCTSIACNLEVGSSSMVLLRPLRKTCMYDPPLLEAS